MQRGKASETGFIASTGFKANFTLQVVTVPTSGVRSRKTSKTSLASLQNGIIAGKEGLSHLMHLTREVMPRIDNYRDIFKSTTRPSIDELHESSAPEQVNLIRPLGVCL